MKLTPILYSTILCLCFVACAKEPISISKADYVCENQLTISHPDKEQFDAFLEKKVTEGLPGITMLIETPKGLWAGAAGYAEISEKIPMEVCTISRIGSITKTFTATLILQLYEKGLLQLSDPISQYLDQQVADKITNSEKITIEQLLNHTSGLADFVDDLNYSIDFFNNTRKHVTALDELEYIFNKPAKFEPGTQRRYTNINFVLLGIIAEKLTGESGVALYEKYIFKPLDMNNTYFDQSGSIPPRGTARGYSDEENDRVLIDRTNMRFAHNSMAGGIVANVADLRTYIQAVIRKGGGLLDTDIVKQLAVVKPVEIDKTISEKDLSFKNNGVGLGWFNLKGNETDRGAIGHGGSMRGYQAFAAYFPETEITICYLINGNDGQMDEIEDFMRGHELMPLLFE